MAQGKLNTKEDLTGTYFVCHLCFWPLVYLMLNWSFNDPMSSWGAAGAFILLVLWASLWAAIPDIKRQIGQAFPNIELLYAGFWLSGLATAILFVTSFDSDAYFSRSHLLLTVLLFGVIAFTFAAKIRGAKRFHGESATDHLGLFSASWICFIIFSMSSPAFFMEDARPSIPASFGALWLFFWASLHCIRKNHVKSLWHYKHVLKCDFAKSKGKAYSKEDISAAIPIAYSLSLSQQDHLPQPPKDLQDSVAKPPKKVETIKARTDRFLSIYEKIYHKQKTLEKS